MWNNWLTTQKDKAMSCSHTKQQHQSREGWMIGISSGMHDSILHLWLSCGVGLVIRAREVPYALCQFRTQVKIVQYKCLAEELAIRPGGILPIPVHSKQMDLIKRDQAANPSSHFFAFIAGSHLCCIGSATWRKKHGSGGKRPVHPILCHPYVLREIREGSAFSVYTELSWDESGKLRNNQMDVTWHISQDYSVCAIGWANHLASIGNLEALKEGRISDRIRWPLLNMKGQCCLQITEFTFQYLGSFYKVLWVGAKTILLWISFLSSSAFVAILKFPYALRCPDWETSRPIFPTLNSHY